MPRPALDREKEIDRPPPSLAEKRIEQISHAAVALFSERGYVATKIEDISNEIGVGKGLIYRYFQDKQDLLFHALCAVLEKYKTERFIVRLETEGPLAALRRVLDVHCRLAQEHTQEVILAYRSTKDLLPEQRHRIKALESDLVGEIRRILEACIEAGLMQPFNVEVMAYQVLMYGHTWALKLWALGTRLTVEQYVAEGERLLIVPFLTEAGRRKFDNESANEGAEQAPARISRRAPRR